jgi:hypothetical protein
MKYKLSLWVPVRQFEAVIGLLLQRLLPHLIPRASNLCCQSGSTATFLIYPTTLYPTILEARSFYVI